MKGGTHVHVPIDGRHRPGRFRNRLHARLVLGAPVTPRAEAAIRERRRREVVAMWQWLGWVAGTFGVLAVFIKAAMWIAA